MLAQHANYDSILCIMRLALFDVWSTRRTAWAELVGRPVMWTAKAVAFRRSTEPLPNMHRWPTSGVDCKSRYLPSEHRTTSKYASACDSEKKQRDLSSPRAKRGKIFFFLFLPSIRQVLGVLGLLYSESLREDLFAIYRTSGWGSVLPPSFSPRLQLQIIKP
jgi:hypothetical protein